jgi:hypothetical protein
MEETGMKTSLAVLAALAYLFVPPVILWIVLRPDSFWTRLVAIGLIVFVLVIQLAIAKMMTKGGDKSDKGNGVGGNGSSCVALQDFKPRV